SGMLSWLSTLVGVTPIDWFNDAPMLAIIMIVAWQWLPFATLILLTALQSQDEEQKEAAEMDGAGAFSTFLHLTLPHLARPITVVILKIGRASCRERVESSEVAGSLKK